VASNLYSVHPVPEELYDQASSRGEELDDQVVKRFSNQPLLEVSASSASDFVGLKRNDNSKERIN
jgi:hypothetical protein